MVVLVSSPSLGDAELAAIGRVMSSGYLGMGAETRLFERELEQFFGAGRSVVCSSSGTAALHLALEALGLGPGDEILIPSLTFVATFQAVRACGATAVACDVRLEDGLLDLEDARRRITSRTRAVVPVHYAGFAGDWTGVHDLARVHGLRVVEDAAHAFGSRQNGIRIGAAGDVVCFSFDPIKNITSGEGGAVVTADVAVAQRARQMRQLGLPVREDALEPLRGRGLAHNLEVELPGWRYHMPNLAAAIGRVQLARFEAELMPRRMQLVRRYRERLSGIPHVRLFASSDEVVPHLLPIRLIDADRDRVQGLLAERGYETAVHYKPNHLHPLFRSASPLPRAEQLFGEILSLPLHGQVREADIDAIAELIRTRGRG